MMLNETSLESKKFYVTKCQRINLNYNPSNILGKVMEFPTKPGLTGNSLLEAFQIFHEYKWTAK